MHLLITSGATREPIDDVRFLSNISTGSTGAALADALHARGHAVTLLHGLGAAQPQTLAPGDRHAFSSTDDLQRQLRTLLGSGRYDAVIQCAAVSDYRPAELQSGKMSSDRAELTLHLVPTPKLLPQLKTWSPPERPLTVIGFKLTSGADAAAREKAVARLFAAGTVDAAVHNDLTELTAGAGRTFRGYSAAAFGKVPADVLPGLPALFTWLDARVRTPTPALA